MIDKFEELIINLGKHLSTSLKVDDFGFCSLIIDDKITIQMQMDSSLEYLFIGSFLTEIPPGKFKENIFTWALKANNQIPKTGIFGYNEKTNELMLFEYLKFSSLTSDFLNKYITIFIEKAFAWKEAIATNQPAPLEFIQEAKINV